MTDQHPRPTPGLLAARPRPPADPAPATPAAPAAPATPAAVAAVAGGRFDRHIWEQAIRYSTLHPYSRLLAMMLAHHADRRGHIPSGDVLVAARLAKACGVPVQDTHISLNVLHREGFIERGAGDGHAPRPVTLTLPHAYRRPHSPGGRP